MWRNDCVSGACMKCDVTKAAQRLRVVMLVQAGRNQSKQRLRGDSDIFFVQVG